MEKGYKKIFWGFLITIFNINIGPVNLLPNFIGYYFIGSGLNLIYEEFENDNFKRANTISNFLMAYSLIMGIIYYAINDNIIGTGIYGRPAYTIINSILTTLIISVILIMTIKIISGTIDLYLHWGMNDEAIALINKQRKYLILSLIGILLTTLVPNIINEYLITGMAIYLLIINLYFVAIIRDVKLLEGDGEINEI